jgi:hypothetical protein
MAMYILPDCIKHIEVWYKTSEGKHRKLLQSNRPDSIFNYHMDPDCYYIIRFTDETSMTLYGTNIEHYLGDFYDMRMSESLESASYQKVDPKLKAAINQSYRDMVDNAVTAWPNPTTVQVGNPTVKLGENHPSNLVDTNLKTAAAAKKPKLSDVPPVALFALGAAMSDGKEKYGRFNWRETGSTASVFYDAMMRHLADWYNGEDFADDSKVHHLGHLMASCAILLDSSLHGKLNDDRQKYGTVSRNVTWIDKTPKVISDKFGSGAPD